MTLWQAVVLGLVQGLTEFLPVSSSGHLVLAEHLLGVTTPGVFVEVALHVATLGSVFVVYGGRILAIGQGLVTGSETARRYVSLLVVATIPAGVVGVVWGRVIERAFDSLFAVGLAFLATAAILWSTRRRGGSRELPTTAGAAGIGMMQAVAVLPGVSRSGATVAAGLWRGLSPVRAAEFSFLMAVPTIAGAAVLKVPEAVAATDTVGAGALLLACAAALGSGVWAIRFLVALLARGRFHAFAPYCAVLGLLTLSLALWRP